MSVAVKSQAAPVMVSASSTNRPQKQDLAWEGKVPTVLTLLSGFLHHPPTGSTLSRHRRGRQDRPPQTSNHPETPGIAMYVLAWNSAAVCCNLTMGQAYCGWWLALHAAC